MFYLVPDWKTATNNMSGQSLVSKNLPAVDGERYTFSDSDGKFTPSSDGEFSATFNGLYNIADEIVQKYHLVEIRGTGSVCYKIFNREDEAKRFRGDRSCDFKRLLNEVSKM
jgi:hypothetical protein